MAFSYLATWYDGDPDFALWLAEKVLAKKLSKTTLDHLDKQRERLFPEERPNMYQENVLEVSLASQCLARVAMNMSAAETDVKQHQQHSRQYLLDILTAARDRGRAWLRKNEAAARSFGKEKIEKCHPTGDVLYHADFYEIAHITLHVAVVCEAIEKRTSLFRTPTGTKIIAAIAPEQKTNKIEEIRVRGNAAKESAQVLIPVLTLDFDLLREGYC